MSAKDWANKERASQTAPRLPAIAKCGKLIGVTNGAVCTYFRADEVSAVSNAVPANGQMAAITGGCMVTLNNGAPLFVPTSAQEVLSFLEANPWPLPG